MGKKANRPTSTAPPRAAKRRFSFWFLVPLLLVVGLGAALLAVGWTSEYDALREADSTEPEMVSIPGGTFRMGRDDGPDDEKPAHEVTVGPFQMDATEVTVGQFAQFVKATGYVTVAERTP